MGSEQSKVACDWCNEPVAMKDAVHSDGDGGLTCPRCAAAAEQRDMYDWVRIVVYMPGMREPGFRWTAWIKHPTQPGDALVGKAERVLDTKEAAREDGERWLAEQRARGVLL